MVNLLEAVFAKRPKKGETIERDAGDKPAAFADTLWFASLIGLVGGFATILTNSMGPILNGPPEYPRAFPRCSRLK